MEKSITYLNNKIWYRLAKVIYIFAFLIISVFVIIIIFSENVGTLDIANSQIFCQFGENKQFLVKDVFNKDETPSYLPIYYSNNNQFSRKIINSCSTPLDPNKSTYTSEELLASGRMSKYLIDPYRIEKSYKSNKGTLILYSLIGIAIIILIFELFKRVFYYVVLGTINPKK